MINTLIGKTFHLFPDATYRIEGMLLDADEHGLCFRITMSHDPKYKVHAILFVSKGKGIVAILLEGNEDTWGEEE